MSNLLHRIATIVLAALFVYGGLLLVVGSEALMQPSTWTDYQKITLLIIAVTVGAGHFTNKAFDQRSYLACIGFALVFVTGTYLSARQSLDRQAETAAATTLSAEAANGTLADKAADLADAKQRLKYAEDQVQSESTGQRCGDRCERWKRTAADRRTVVSSIERDIAALGPPKPVNAGREHFGDTAAAMGFKKDAAMGFDALLLPFLKFFVFEIGSLVSLGFALQSNVKPVRVSVPANDTSPTPPTRKPLPSVSGQLLSFQRPHKVLAALESEKGPVSNARLAQLLGETEGEASKSWREVSEHLEIGRQGKELRIALRRTA